MKKTRDGDAAWRLSVGENGGGEEDWRMDLPPAFVVMPHLGARFGLDLPSSLVAKLFFSTPSSSSLHPCSHYNGCAILSQGIENNRNGTSNASVVKWHILSCHTQIVSLPTKETIELNDFVPA